MRSAILVIANSNSKRGGRQEGRSQSQFIESDSASDRLEKGKVEAMTTVQFLHKARHALVPMRKAAMDALLLTAFIFIGFLFLLPGILLGYPWLVLPTYALAYLLTVVLRLRQAAREIGSPRSPYNYLFH